MIKSRCVWKSTDFECGSEVVCWGLVGHVCRPQCNLGDPGVEYVPFSICCFSVLVYVLNHTLIAVIIICN